MSVGVSQLDHTSTQKSVPACVQLQWSVAAEYESLDVSGSAKRSGSLLP